ncbi:hypothetical protein CDIK_0461 [Cucumispora dikerogammari]|nr:hypothetical protein CDIK_0461 [Cucumispora dikerogammari]
MKFSINLMAIKITLKERLLVEEVAKMFDVLCGKCLGEIEIDFRGVGCVDDIRFVSCDVDPQIIYNSFELFNKKTISVSDFENRQLMENIQARQSNNEDIGNNEGNRVQAVPLLNNEEQEYQYNRIEVINRPCIFNKFCKQKVNRETVDFLKSFSLPEIMTISFNKRKNLVFSDVYLMKRIDEKYDSDLQEIFKAKLTKKLKIGEIVKYEDLLIEFEQIQNVILKGQNTTTTEGKVLQTDTKNKSGAEGFQKETNEEEPSVFRDFLNKIAALKNTERTELFTKIGSLNPLNGFRIFTDLIMKGEFFKELDIQMFLKFTDLKLLKGGVSKGFLEKLVKAVVSNMSSYNEDDILNIIYGTLYNKNFMSLNGVITTDFMVNTTDSSRESILNNKVCNQVLTREQTEEIQGEKQSERDIILNILLYIKQTLNSEFTTNESLDLIQKICLKILDFIELIKDTNKMEMLLEIIYEKVKIKSKYFGRHVKIKNVKR